MLQVYIKDKEFDVLKKPKVTYVGERGNSVITYLSISIHRIVTTTLIGTGLDLGGLTRDYFSNGHSGLRLGKYEGHTIFEGEVDHLLPTSSSVLKTSSVYIAVGKFMAHAYINVGVAMSGLSPAAVHYLLCENPDDLHELPMRVEDIPDPDAREVVQIVSCTQRRL